MKQCTICHKTKSKTEFNKHAGRKDGLQSHCRECNKTHSKKYYSNNRETHKKEIQKRKKSYIDKCRKWIYDYLNKHPCVDCGENDPVVLEFDHIKGHKVNNVSKMIQSNPTLTTIQNEIRKCAVRCANCHRRKTAKDQGWWKL